KAPPCWSPTIDFSRTKQLLPPRQLRPHFAGAGRASKGSPCHRLTEIQHIRYILAEKFIHGLKFSEGQLSERLVFLLRQSHEFADHVMRLAKGHSLPNEIVRQIRRQQ